METKTKGTADTVNVILRLPVIRHVRAIFELIIIFFWRNWFGHGVYIHPHKEEIEKVYHIWCGTDKKAHFYMDNIK
jgi:hypothetical protein